MRRPGFNRSACTWGHEAENRLIRLATKAGPDCHAFRLKLQAAVEERAVKAGRPYIHASDVLAAHQSLLVEGQLNGDD